MRRSVDDVDLGLDLGVVLGCCLDLKNLRHMMHASVWGNICRGKPILPLRGCSAEYISERKDWNERV